jgi:hypothetical protein
MRGETQTVVINFDDDDDDDGDEQELLLAPPVVVVVVVVVLVNDGCMFLVQSVCACGTVWDRFASMPKAHDFGSCEK